MAVSYLEAGAEITAAHMSELFDGLEAKVGALLDWKTPFLLPRQVQLRMLGSIYFFTNGTRPVVQQWVTIIPGLRNYNENPYLDGLATVTEGPRDELNKTLNITQPTDPNIEIQLGQYYSANKFLELSLTAWQRNGYWLLEDQTFQIDPTVRSWTNYCPQKVYKYAVAEMVYDGIGFESVLIPQRWNKFNFFRFHNCNSYDMTIRFEGASDFSVTIGKYSCATVRRDSVTSGYSKRWHYFWPFESNDPRCYSFPNDGTRDTVWKSMAANNIINPCLIYDWIQNFSEPIGAIVNPVQFYRDTHAVYNIGDIYSDKFGDASNQSTLIGDLLHHSGTVRVLSRDTGVTEYTQHDCEYHGYGSIAEDLGASGVRVDEIDNRLKLTGTIGNAENIIVGIGTNLLDDATNDGVGYTLNSSKPVDLVNPITQDTRVEEMFQTTVTLDSGTWEEYGSAVYSLGGGNVSLLTPGIGYIPNLSNVNPIRIHKTTLQTVLKLNAFGLTAYDATNQDTDYATFVDRRAALTITGLKLMFEQSLSLRGSHLAESEVSNGDEIVAYQNTQTLCYVFAFRPNEGTRNGAGVKIKGSISFDGYGWPANGSRIPAFLSPRLDRAYSDTIYGQAIGDQRTPGAFYAHTNVTNDPIGVDGVDFDLDATAKAYETIGVSKLSAMTQTFPEFPKQFPKWLQPDDLYYFWQTNFQNAPAGERAGHMPRLFLLIELYNDMAATVNSVTGCFPLTYLNIPFDLGDGTAAYLSPNTTGVAGNNMPRPLNQYAGVDTDSDLYKLCVKLGIRIRTVDDFPQSYRDMMANLGSYYEGKVNEDKLSFTLVTNTEDDPGLYRYPYAHLFPDGPYNWVAIEDVKQAVEGWVKFLYRETCVPLELSLESASAPAKIWTQTGTYPIDVFHNFPASFWMFKQTEQAQWKMNVDYPILCDYEPGDDRVYKVGRLFVKSQMEKSVRTEIMNCTFKKTNYVRRLAFLRYASAGIANGSSIVFVPIPYWGHASDGYSSASLANASMRAYGAALPLIQKETSSAIPSVDIQDDGVTFTGNVVDSAFEPTFFLTDQIALT